MSGVGAKPELRLFPASLEPWVPVASNGRGTGSGREIAVLMSGGVDSSVAALLLKEGGWRVLGITMKLPVAAPTEAPIFGNGRPRLCCGLEAARVCRELGIPHYFLDVTAAFQELVIEPFRRAYSEGRTPSPCVDCNTAVKFGLVWDFIEETFRISWLATGHYARIVNASGAPCLARAADPQRDQSYFLYGIPRERLSRLAFPVGELDKAAARDRARQAGLPTAERPDSMELCFADEGDYRRALGQADASRPGPILDMAGRVIGQHQGIANYTVGQRRGLRLAAGRPLYVARISPRDNSVTLGTRDDASCRTVRAARPNVLLPEGLRPGERLLGKLRSFGEPSPCTVAEARDETLAVEFDAPQFAPAPGQHLVLYDAEGRVVAGGVIADPASDIQAGLDQASRTTQA